MSHETQASFSASISQVGHLAEVFSSLNVVSSQGLVIISEKGIAVYCEKNHILNCQAVIDVSLFTSFNLLPREHSQPTQEHTDRGRSLRFGLDLSLVNYSFGVLSGNAKDTICYMSYNGEGTPFVIEFEDPVMSESIEFLTFYYENNYPYDNLDNEGAESFDLVVNYNELEYDLILKSDSLTNLLYDLIQINTEDLYLYLSQVDGSEVSFISKGPIGYSKLIYPSEKTILEKLEIFNAQEKSMSTFKFSNFIKVFKGVRLSSKCKIVKDTNGVFSIQLICRDPTSNSYAGTLLTYNMLETSTDIDTSMLVEQFEEIEPANKQKRQKIADPNGSRNIQPMYDAESHEADVFFI